MKEYTVSIPNMMCEHCEKRIRGALEEIGSTVKSISLENKKVVLDTDVSETELLEAIDKAGYDAEIII